MPLALRERRSVIVSVGDRPTTDTGIETVAAALSERGIETTYLGHDPPPEGVATSVVESSADSVEVLVVGGGGVRFLLALLRELTRAGRRGVGIVVHRVQ